MQFLIDLLTKDELYKARLHDLTKRKVVKLEHFIKCVFYLLEIDREAICEDNTQKLFWKKAKNLWNEDLIKKMVEYRFEGPKEHAIKKYQALNFIEPTVKGLNNEDICVYNQALGLIQRWMILAIDARKRDVAYRLNESKKKREEREEKTEQDRDRTERRTGALEEAAAKFDTENRAEIEKYEEY